MIMPKFPHYKQLDSMDCGPTCLRMVAKYYGKTYSLQYLRSRSYITREGVSMLGISEAAENIGFRTKGYRLTWEELCDKRRRELDYKRFQQSSADINNIVQLVHGMQEIKLNACEKQKRWEWESIQARLYRVSIKVSAPV